VHHLRLELQRERGRLAALRVALEVERERYGDLFDFAPIGYASLDGTGIIQDINLSGARSARHGSVTSARHAAAGTHGTGRPPPLPRPPAAVPHRLRPATHSTSSFRAPTEAWVPVQLLSKRGSPRDVGATMLCAIVDMSDREEAVAERWRNAVEHERMEHAGEVARGGKRREGPLSGGAESRAPDSLSPILFTVEMLERGHVPPERVADAVALIKRNLDLEVRLIDDLLDVSRITQRSSASSGRSSTLQDVVRDVTAGVAADVEQRRADPERRARGAGVARRRRSGAPAADRVGISSAMPFATRHPAGKIRHSLRTTSTIASR
jgi:hypothetical protein